MLMKHLYVCGYEDIDKFKFMHMPLDSYIFNALDETIDFPKNNKKWADLNIHKWGDLKWSQLEEADYDECQKQIQEFMKNNNDTQLFWEFYKWLEIAQRNT